jgi:diphosphomevalonate decarboxylase
MVYSSATAVAHPNIAFIKYWGNKDDSLRIPVNGSLSMNLESLSTQTTVEIDSTLDSDQVKIDGVIADSKSTMRISTFLSFVRRISDRKEYAFVSSHNNFPSGSGIASSASGFAALALAASTAYGLRLTEKELSRLARRGSGSACRSIPGGFVEWQPGTTDDNSYAFSIADINHWDLIDIVAIVDASHKKTGSTEGHAIANSSPLQISRVEDAPRRLQKCRKAILDRDFSTFAEIVEQDCLMMHAVMMTSNPSLLYWKPATLELITKVISMRQQGLPICYTIDAGPNVHILSLKQYQSAIVDGIKGLAGVLSYLYSPAGGGAYISG